MYGISQELLDRLTKMHNSGASFWSLKQLCPWIQRDNLRTAIALNGGNQNRANKSTDPTPAEIEERAAEVRQSWSDEEMALRFVGRGSRMFSEATGDDIYG